MRKTASYIVRVTRNVYKYFTSPRYRIRDIFSRIFSFLLFINANSVVRVLTRLMHFFYWNALSRNYINQMTRLTQYDEKTISTPECTVLKTGMNERVHETRSKKRKTTLEYFSAASSTSLYCMIDQILSKPRYTVRRPHQSKTYCFFLLFALNQVEGIVFVFFSRGLCFFFFRQ